MVDATAGHDLEFGRGCRDGKAAARIAAHMRQVEMGGVVGTVGADIEAVPPALAVCHRHGAPFPHVDIIAKERRIRAYRRP